MRGWRPLRLAARASRCWALGLLGWANLASPALAQAPTTYAGPCDASAAVGLGADHFVVANDEVNTLAVYRRGQAGPVDELALDRFLGTAGGKESDIEGAAAIGDRIYWITSHGRNSKGRAEEGRYRFFATEIRPGSPATLKPVHIAYRKLLDDMIATEALAPYQLAAASRLAAEADGGLNIEGLAARRDGGLLIGFRNPLREGRALLIPFENPAEVVEHARHARFGPPIELDLGRRGVRSIELVGDVYYLVAGPTADKGSFALYRWSGRAGDPAQPLTGIDLASLRPEALFALPGNTRLQLLSDDGGVRIGGRECKDFPKARQAFRSLVVEP